MAFKFARQSGPYTSGSTWDNGTAPAVGDWIYSNGYTVDINQNIDVESLRNSTTRIGVPDIATPIMTSNTTPIGYIVSSSTLGGTPWTVFSQNTTTNGSWTGHTGGKGTIWFNFPTGSTGPIIKRYAIWKYSPNQIYQPVNWSLSGRNSISEAWNTIEIVSGSTVAALTYFSPTLANTASYTMYQLDITATYNMSYPPIIAALELTTDTGSAQGWGNSGGFTITGSRNLNFSGEGIVSNGGTLLTINSTTGSIINFTKSGSGYIMGPNCQIGSGDIRVINIANTATINYTGDLYGTRNAGCTYTRTGQFGVGAAATVNIIGNVYGCEMSSYESFAVGLLGNGATINITGNVYGQTNTAMRGAIYCTAIGNLNITGTIYSTLGNCIWITGNTKLTHNGTIQNTNANGYPAIISSANSLTAPVIISGPIYSTSSIVSVNAYRLQFQQGQNISWQYQNTANQNVTLYSYPAGLPSASDIRSGSRYGGSNEFVGSLIVADPSNVRKGVPTDNTTGSAQLTAADFLTALSSSSDPLAVRLRNVATVDTVGGQIAAFTP